MYNVSYKRIILQYSDGQTGLFAIVYFCAVVIFGHYYLLKLLLAVINSNLMSIIASEAREDMAERMKLVEEDELKLKQEEEKLNNVTTKQTADKPQNPLIEMAQALKAARAAKLQEKKLMEEEAKKKEEMQTQPMTSMSVMIEAIKRAKAEKIAREKALKEELDKQD